MGPPLAYLLVIAVWSTTPLAIKLSSEYFTPLAAASMRFLLAAGVACCIVALLHGSSGLKLRHWKAYAVASLAIFPNMPLVYGATQYISSGMVSVMMATAPFVMGALSIVFLRQNPFTPLRLLGLTVALAGLVLITAGQFALGGGAWLGVLLMTASTLTFSLSNVLLKRLDTAEIDPLEQSLGAIVFALPGLLLFWGRSEGELPAIEWNMSLWAIIYLATVGSILGFMAFFYVLRTLPFEIVGLVPLITPVLAMMLGVLVAGEEVSAELAQGSLLILLGLAIYELLPALLRRFGTRLIVVGPCAGASQDKQAAADY